MEVTKAPERAIFDKTVESIARFEYASAHLYLIRCGFGFSESDYIVRAEIKGTDKVETRTFYANDEYKEQKAERTFFETVAMYSQNVHLFDALQAAFEEAEHHGFKHTNAELIGLEG